MNLTKTHYLYYSQRNMPKWAKKVVDIAKLAENRDIDDCVNYHANPLYWKSLNLGLLNSISLFKLIRKRHTVQECIIHLLDATGPQRPKYILWGKRWQRKLEQSKLRK